MFIATLFTIAKTWNQPIDMDKEDVVHMHDGILLSHKKDEIMATQMDLQIIILSEVSQTETSNQSTCCWDFPCSPLVKISCFQCRECRLDLWPWN